MDYDIKGSTAELILTDAIDDYAKATGKSIEDVRSDIIESGAYDALFNFDTGLWKEGPDYFIEFYLALKGKNRDDP